MKVFLFLFFITILLSCKTSSSTSVQVDQNQWLIDSLVLEEYAFAGEANLPNGMSPSLIAGYTDRVNGIYHLKELNVASLQIISLKFQKEDTNWTRQVYFYQFLFDDKKEEAQFENFQKLILNYQQHSKNQVAFFKRNSFWYLKFIPMP